MANIKLQQISKRYGDKEILSNISLEIRDGEMLALLGPSGSGKTSILNIIAGLVAPTSGQVCFNDIDYTKVPANNRKAIIVFQDHALFPHMTVSQNVAFGLKARRMERRIIADKVAEILELVQIPDKGNSFPGELSGGQRQRVALARACVLEPEVLLLDEPFSNLDTSLRQNMREFVASLQQRLKFTCILVTHDKEEAFMLSKRVALILSGCLEQLDTPGEVYRRPSTRALSDFIGDANYIRGYVKNGVFHCDLGKFGVEAKDSDEATGMIRCSQIALERKAEGHHGTIVEKKFAGKSTYYAVDASRGIILQVDSPHHDFEIGETVALQMRPTVLNVY